MKMKGCPRQQKGLELSSNKQCMSVNVVAQVMASLPTRIYLSEDIIHKTWVLILRSSPYCLPRLNEAQVWIRFRAYTKMVLFNTIVKLTRGCYWPLLLST